MKLNGIKHKSAWLTEEEKVVIDALRAGATARINWFDLTYEEIVKITDELPKSVLPIRETRDFCNSGPPFVVVEAKSEKVELNLYVDLRTKKATAGTVTK